MIFGFWDLSGRIGWLNKVQSNENEKVETLLCAAAGSASDRTRTVYGTNGSREPWTGKDL